MSGPLPKLHIDQAGMMREPHQSTRQEIYDQVWTRPMTKVAAELGISDVALKKICVKLRIPVPGRGYPPALSVLIDWARQPSNVLRETTSPQAIMEALHESPLFDLSSE